MRRVIQKRIRRTGEGIDLAVDLNAVLAVNDGREDPDAREAERAADPPGQDAANEQGRISHE